MAKIVLTSARDIALDKLVASDVNVRRIKAGVSVEDLAEDTIRRMLTEGAVKTSDRRAVFIGVEVYESAGGSVLRDLFSSDTGGWLQNAALLDKLAREKLAKEADRVGAEGWKWAEFSIDFPYRHTAGLRRLPATQAPLTEEEQARHEGVLAEYAALSDEYEGADELPEEVDRRLGELEQSITAVDERLPVYAPATWRAPGFLSASTIKAR